MISFENPGLLLLLIPLLLLGYFCHCKLRSVALLQILITLVLVCSLAGISVEWPRKEGILFILCDRSLSMPGDAEKRMEEQIRAISKNMKISPGIISFAGEKILEQAPGMSSFRGFDSQLSNRDISDVHGALELALSLIPQDTPGRILLISDGRWNGISPEKSFYTAAMRKIKVDFLPLERTQINDFSISGISAPMRTIPGESCALNCRIYAPFAARVKCRIRKNKGNWIERTVQLKSGENHILWRDRNLFSGIVSYEFQLLPPPGDTIAENNRAEHLLEIKGENKILLLTNSPSGNLEKLLRKANFKVDTFTLPAPRLSPGMLGGYQSVILENFPASALSRENNALIAELVKNGRMGVVMTGGKSSFAVGGWYKTPIGEILPVSMEKQNHIRRRNSAVMMALDRSGSMAANVDGVTKMIMANRAAAGSYAVLAPEDEFGLIAVDSSVHQVVPLAEKKSSPDPTGDILAIESMGGGIFVDKALHECVRQLMRSKAPVRHLLLFADAADAEQPGDYKELLARSSKAGITVSVVGLGRPSDSDAELLRDIARRGGGKCYFAEDALELPRIFAEDTFVMVRNSFLSEKVTGTFTPLVSTIPGAERLKGKVEANGYNLCFAREKSSVLLAAQNEDSSPLAVTGFAGMGRTAALMLEADGEFSGKFAQSAAAPALLTALVRYTVMSRNRGGNEYMVLQSVREGEFKCEIHLDPERKKEPFRGTPRLSVLISRKGGKVEKRVLECRWENPDLLSVTTLIPPGAVINSALEIQGEAPFILAPAVQSITPEFARAEGKELLHFVRAAGGRIKSNFDDTGKFLPRGKERRSCVSEMLAAAVVLLLLQVFCRRCGMDIKFPEIQLPRFKWKARAPKVPRIRKKTQPAPVKSEEKEHSPQEDAISSALKRAKRQ